MDVCVGICVCGVERVVFHNETFLLCSFVICIGYLRQVVSF